MTAKTYQAGPEGVEVLEFRATITYDSRVRESPEGWQRIIESAREHRELWATDIPSTP